MRPPLARFISVALRALRRLSRRRDSSHRRLVQAGLMTAALAMTPDLGAQQLVYQPNGRAQVVGGKGTRHCESHKSEGVELISSAPSVDSAITGSIQRVVDSRFRPEDSNKKRAAQIAFVLRRNGTIARLTFLSHSADPGFDEVAQTSITDAADAKELPVLPASVTDDTAQFVASFGRRTANADPYIAAWQICPAWPLADNPRPAYPTQLRRQSVQGEVAAQFIVDTLGRVRLETVKVLHSSAPEFTTAVQDVLPALRYFPAEVKGRRLPQVTEQVFRFAAEK